jgi:HSP20 family molecular chaperone IbpA
VTEIGRYPHPKSSPSDFQGIEWKDKILVENMSSFLERLKKKDVVASNTDDAKKDQIAAQNKPVAPDQGPPAEQLKVDIYQTPGAILIYSQIAGASIHDFSVMIEGDGDIVTIKGQRTKPNGDVMPVPGADTKEHILEECSWGKFYRQIILPAEVDAAKTEAKMREGVLVLLLPLKESSSKGIRINVTQV